MYRLAGAAIVIATTLVFMSCATESYSEAEGAESGPCYPNGTCNGGLACISNRCVRNDTTGDGGEGGAADAGTGTDASTDGTAIGDAVADAGPSCPGPVDHPPIKCGAGECVSQVCCAGDNVCTAFNQPCDGGSVPIACLSDRCGSASVCCSDVGVGDTSVCPTTLADLSYARCSPTCAVSEVQLCSAADVSPCPVGKTCMMGFLQGLPGGNTSVGFCR